ncbi:MAG TPA: type II/IV secretion system protein, partial [Pirellulaceae bacterium]|nr:type II/IV secretion system protein [Pirellulaceae bacterium]
MSAAETIDFTTEPLTSQQPAEAVARVVREAVGRQASDLFLFSDESAVNIAVRTLGHVERLATVSRESGRHLISYFKTLAGIDIA